MMPSLFISHGSPTILIEKDSVGRAFLSGLAEKYERPKAILVVSAHWETLKPMVTSAENLKTIHDFYGFPQTLFDMEYPAKNDGVLSAQLQDMLGAVAEPVRGLDHGAWSVLKLMYPEADIPVVQLSLQSQQPPVYHYDIGKNLSGLRKDGVMIIGSGATTHNLGAIRWNSLRPDDWAQAYEDWMVEKVEANDQDALINAEKEAPSFEMSHPRDEHWLPFYVAMGAGGQGHILHRGFEHGNLSMAAVEFD
ncbi:MAG: dioxygenase [Methylocystaceae bacterium]|nr:dioxygenase [Methylocystaceae bacterium]